MKKKTLFILATLAVVLLMSSLTALNGHWRAIDDKNCNKCVITDTERKCGKCGSFMSDGRVRDSTRGYVWECTFTCKNPSCGHLVIGGYK